jgi:hypothetical protein
VQSVRSRGRNGAEAVRDHFSRAIFDVLPSGLDDADPLLRRAAPPARPPPPPNSLKGILQNGFRGGQVGAIGFAAPHEDEEPRS